MRRDGSLWAWLTVLALAGGLAGRVEAEDAALEARAQSAAALLDSQDPYQRQVGFIRLEALRDPATGPVIRRHLTSKDTDHRAQAVRALGAIEGVRAVPDLIRSLRQDQDAEVRRAALLGLEPLVPLDPQILPALIEALRDRKVEVRMSAIDVVSRIDDPRAREAIRERDRRERNRNARRVLTAAMDRLGDG